MPTPGGAGESGEGDAGPAERVAATVLETLRTRDVAALPPPSGPRYAG